MKLTQMILFLGLFSAMIVHSLPEAFQAPHEMSEDEIINSKTAWEHLKNGHVIRAIKRAWRGDSVEQRVRMNEERLEQSKAKSDGNNFSFKPKQVRKNQEELNQELKNTIIGLFSDNSEKRLRTVEIDEVKQALDDGAQPASLGEYLRELFENRYADQQRTEDPQNVEILSILITSGLSPDYRFENGESLIALAMKNNQPQTARLLQEKGAKLLPGQVAAMPTLTGIINQ